MNSKTSASPVRALMVAYAHLCLVVATNVPALPDTQAADALMTQMNVPSHPPSARTKANASTPWALTSVTVPLVLPVQTVRAPTFPVHRHPALMAALARAQSLATPVTACQDSMALTVRTT